MAPYATFLKGAVRLLEGDSSAASRRTPHVSRVHESTLSRTDRKRAEPCQAKKDEVSTLSENVTPQLVSDSVTPSRLFCLALWCIRFRASTVLGSPMGAVGGVPFASAMAWPPK